MNTCSICWCNLENDLYKTKCNHYFHLNCIFKWLKHVDRHLIKKGDNGVLEGTCPNCRQPISIIVFSKKNTKDFNTKTNIFSILFLIFGKGIGYKIYPNTSFLSIEDESI